MSTKPYVSAFPCHSRDAGDFSGLTKREYIAAMAMQGLLSSEEKAPFEAFAYAAVKMADALIAELNKEEK